MDKNVLCGLYYFVPSTFELLISVATWIVCLKQDCNRDFFFSFLYAYWFAIFIMQSKLIDLSLLSAVEVDWLNDYHSQVWEKVIFHI